MSKSDLELFSKWQSLSQLEPLPKWSRPEDLSGFFQRFKPSSAEVAQVFAGLPKGESVLERLNQIYAATQHNESGASSAKYLEIKHHGVEIRFEAGGVIRGYVGQCLD